MKEYPIHFGDRDRLNEDLKPIRRRSLLHLMIGVAGTLFGIRELAKSSYIGGRADVMSDLQTEIESMTEKEEQ